MFKNKSLSSMLIGYCNSIKMKFFWFNLYRKTYENYVKVILNQYQKNFPIRANLKSGKKITAYTLDELALYALLTINSNMRYDENEDLLTVNLPSNFSSRKIELYGTKQNTDTILAFSNNEGTYDELDVTNKILIDIGACTGDTAIYFTLNGAKQVISVEPFPKNFEILQKNINKNHLNDKIIPVLGGCSSSKKELVIDPNFKSGMRSILRQFPKGIKISTITLDEIIKKFQIKNNAILKLDCEGCEYDVILNASDSTLNHFSVIQIEYHNGFKNLKTRLINLGFEVSNPIVDNAFRGHIIAKKKE